MNGRSIAIYGKTIQDEFFPYLEKMLCRIKAEGIALDCEVGFAAFLAEHFGCRDWFRQLYRQSDFPREDTALLLSIGGALCERQWYSRTGDEYGAARFSG